MDYLKRLYILIGILFLVILIIFLVWFFSKEEEKFVVSLCPEEITYQGDVYKTVKIGEQCWLAENLKATSYRDDTAIPNFTNSTEWTEDKQGAYGCYYNQERYCDDYGALYSWYAVNNEKGLCPEGWSVPTTEQWAELEREVCQDLGYEDCQERFPNESASGWRGTDEGLHLRTVDLEGKDSYGFKAIFGGFRNAVGSYSFLDGKGFWWTLTSSGNFVFVRVIEKDNDGIRRIESIKSNGFSVRCVKN